jgi:hypothetical protein
MIRRFLVILLIVAPLVMAGCAGMSARQQRALSGGGDRCGGGRRNGGDHRR